MRILGIDTTTRCGSVAVTEEGRALGSLSLAGALDHSEQLLPSIEYFLSRLRLEAGDLAGIGVTQGPGSFTGVRVGLATAGGLSRAWGVPALAQPALEALAALDREAREGEWIAPWLDAGRGQVYAAAYRRLDAGGLQMELAPAVVRPEAWIDGLPACDVRFLGDGSVAYRDLIVRRRGPRSAAASGPWFLALQAALAAGRRLAAAPGASWPVLEPLYLRAPDAELGRTRRR